MLEATKRVTYTHKKDVFLVDSESAKSLMCSNRPTDCGLILACWKRLDMAGMHHSGTMVPTHINVTGTEHTDVLTKEGSVLP